MSRDEQLKNNKNINNLPKDVKEDISNVLDNLKGKSGEEKLKMMLEFKKKFDEKNIDKNLKNNIAKDVSNALSDDEKNAMNIKQ